MIGEGGSVELAVAFGSASVVEVDLPVAGTHRAVPTAGIPPLAASELAHYAWLVGGLLDGAFALAARECSEFSAVPDAIDAARELVDELMARLAPVGDR